MAAGRPPKLRSVRVNLRDLSRSPRAWCSRCGSTSKANHSLSRCYCREPASESTATEITIASSGTQGQTTDFWLNQSELCVPSLNVDGQPVFANITLPVYTLKERGVQVVRSLVSPKNYRRLGLSSKSA